jgi:hypothetical protein
MPYGTEIYTYGISWEIMGFNGIIWDENESQSYPQTFVKNN